MQYSKLLCGKDSVLFIYAGIKLLLNKYLSNEEQFGVDHRAIWTPG